jgi:hypothetical protein
MINFWSQFKGALQGDQVRIGTIAVINGNGTVTCTMANGGSLTVRGSGTVGDDVFILGGEVRSTVSGLTPFADQDV